MIGETWDLSFDHYQELQEQADGFLVLILVLKVVGSLKLWDKRRNWGVLIHALTSKFIESILKVETECRGLLKSSWVDVLWEKRDRDALTKSVLELVVAGGLCLG